MDHAQSQYADLVERAGPSYRLMKDLGLEARLKSDREALDPSAQPSGFGAADWEETLAQLVALDTDLVAQASGTPRPLDFKPGLQALLYRSSVDGVVDAIAAYVPPRPRGRVAFVLHGNPQTESELLAQPYLRNLADETGTILIAPYGRGSYDFIGPATSDLYGLVETVRSMHEFAHADFFLVGYSMGGFTAFMIGPDAPGRWKAVMDISGSLVGSAAKRVLKTWKNTPIYVVFGSSDTSIPTQFGRDTAVFLFLQNVPVSYYEDAHGDHRIRSFLPTLRTAWRDMHDGTVRDNAVGRLARDGVPSLPGKSGTGTTRPD